VKTSRVVNGSRGVEIREPPFSPGTPGLGNTVSFEGAMGALVSAIFERKHAQYDLGGNRGNLQKSHGGSLTISSPSPARSTRGGHRNDEGAIMVSTQCLKGKR